jgi:hypothetical protein
MSQLTLRDIASNEEIIVPPEGFVFGRAGGDADIQLDDNTISRRQARVSSRQGVWVLEVMVVPPGQRIPRPQSLQEGQTFFIGQSEFEVLAVEEDEAPPPPKSVPRKPAPAASAPATKPAARKEPPPPSKTIPAQSAQKRPAPARQPAPVEEEDEGQDDGGAADEAGGEGPQGIKALFVGVPKGIAYYLVNVPKLLVNPLGTVRRAIEELPMAPLGTTALIGYALPAMLATALLGSIAAGLALLIGGFGFSLMSFIPVVPAIIAVVGSVIVGFLFHPVVGWLVKILKGESDERSRSNYFLQMQTVSIVIAVPSALATILGALPIPFINLVGPLLATLTSLVTLYVVYQWWLNCFRVAAWFKYVVLVLGAVLVVSSAIGLVTGVIANIKGLGSGGTTVGSVELSGDAEEALKNAEKLQKEALANADADTKDALAQVEKAREAALAATKAAGKAGGAAAKEAAEAAAKMTKAAEEAARAAEVPDEGSAKTPPPPVRDEPTPTGSGGYGVFARHLEAVEKKLQADPTLLRSADLQRLYGDYLEVAYKLEQTYKKDSSRHPEKERLYRLQRDDQLYTEAGPLVEKLAGKLGVR